MGNEGPWDGIGSFASKGTKGKLNLVKNGECYFLETKLLKWYRFSNLERLPN